MRLRPFLILLSFSFWLSPNITYAEGLFKEYTLEGHKGDFLVVKKNVNVREKPASKGKKLGKLERRQIVDVLGRAKATQWLAVQQNGKDLGFVFQNSLTPLIDASLEDTIKGKIDITSSEVENCRYQMSFVGRAIEEATIFITADYLLYFECLANGETFDFMASMFMSEIPPDLGPKPVYQITLDIPEVAIGYEDFLSLTSLYDHLKQEVRFDQISLKQFAAQDFEKKMSTEAIEDVLKKAIQINFNALNDKAWQTIAGKIPAPGLEKPDP